MAAVLVAFRCRINAFACHSHRHTTDHVCQVLLRRSGSRHFTHKQVDENCASHLIECDKAPKKTTSTKCTKSTIGGMGNDFGDGVSRSSGDVSSLREASAQRQNGSRVVPRMWQSTNSQSELSLDAASRLDLVDRKCRKRLKFMFQWLRLCPW